MLKGLIYLLVMPFLAPVLAQNTPPHAPSSSATVILPLNTMDTLFGGGQITTPCSINGQSLQNCKIDTGANFTTVKKSLLSQQGTLLNQVNLISFSGQSEVCDVTKDNAVHMGPLQLPNSLLVLCPTTASSNIDALIGLDVLAQSTLTVDYKNKRLSFNDIQTTPQGQIFSLDSTGHILVPVQINRKNPFSTKAMVDTGGALTLIHADLVSRHPDAFTVIQDNSVTDTHGNKIVSQLVMINNVQIGDLMIVAEYAMAVDLSNAQELMGKDVEMILGHNSLKNGVWHFSFGDLRWNAHK